MANNKSDNCKERQPSTADAEYKDIMSRASEKTFRACVFVCFLSWFLLAKSSVGWVQKMRTKTKNDGLVVRYFRILYLLKLTFQLIPKTRYIYFVSIWV